MNFDASEYTVSMSGKRSSDHHEILYTPTGSDVGTIERVPRWLAEAFQYMLNYVSTDKDMQQQSSRESVND